MTASALKIASTARRFQRRPQRPTSPRSSRWTYGAPGSSRRPTLRNVGKTAPYMHDGVYETLWDVVKHYNFGGGTGVYSGTKEVTIAPLLLDDRELDDLVEFLRSLDDGAPLPTPDFPEGWWAADAAAPGPVAENPERSDLTERAEVAGGFLEDRDGRRRTAGQHRIVKVDLEQTETAVGAV